MVSSPIHHFYPFVPMLSTGIGTTDVIVFDMRSGPCRPETVLRRDHCNSILTQTRVLLRLPSMVSDVSCIGVSFHPRFIFLWSQRYARAIRTDRGDGAGLRPCGDCANATISPVVRPPLHCFTGLFCPETMFSIRSANCHSGNAIHSTDMLPILDFELTGIIHAPKALRNPRTHGENV
jgi:hypothetical protein